MTHIRTNLQLKMRRRKTQWINN